MGAVRTLLGELNPEKVTLGTLGLGSSTHLLIE
jgi:hypothetical protein